MSENLKKQFGEKFKPLSEKLIKDKRALVIVIAGVLGMLLILLSGTGGEKEIPQTEINSNISLNQNNMKSELEKLIEGIKGAGKTQIMITYECAEESVYATDSQEQSEEGETNFKKEYIIIEDNTGESGLLIKEIYPRVQGVAVICEGGDDPLVKEKIYSLVSALFNINSNNISVASMA